MSKNKQNGKPRDYKKQRPKSPVGTKCRVSDQHGNSTDDVHISGNINDANYYFSDELLKNQLANISFNDFTGVPMTFNNYQLGNESNYKVPTTMIISLNPSAGFTDEATGLGTTLNLAALKLYTELSANNAKTTNYAPQDISMLFLSLGSLISLSSHIARVFGLAYLYSQRNRSYPKGIISSMGVDYDDLMSNFANYRVRYNTIMNAASAIPIPSNVPYFKKCSELYSGVYLDMEGSPMAQSYAFVPFSVWELDESSAETGTQLSVLSIAESGRTMSVLLAVLDTMVSALLNSATLNYIYSDILRLADKGLATMHFTLLPDNYVVIPSYNPEIRKWINNLTVIGKPLSEPDDGYTSGNTVVSDPDNNAIVYRPQFDVSVPGTVLGHILNFDYGTYTADDIIYATRLMSGLKVTGNGATRTERVALPDHYVVNIKVYFNDENLMTIAYPILLEDGNTVAVSRLTAFDWAPIFPIISSAGVVRAIAGDLNYYTTLDYEYLAALQDATYRGLFEIR